MAHSGGGVMPAREKCGNCKHWDAGVCRRYPPQMVSYAPDNQNLGASFPTEWTPTVGAEHPACGEFSKVMT
jgi:hypothetical protein